MYLVSVINTMIKGNLQKKKFWGGGAYGPRGSIHKDIGDMEAVLSVWQVWCV